MEIPFDILDHTFSFLISDPKSLIQCSEAHPVFSRMVEKYLYYHFIIRTTTTASGTHNLFEPSYATKLLSDNPRIATCVRVLQVQFYYRNLRSGMAPYLEQIATILPMFPLLECLVLETYRNASWQEDLPHSFREAVEGCLCLPTLREVHIGCSDFPLSTLDNHANINHFSFSGTPQISGFGDTTYPYLESLSVENIHHEPDDHFRAWAVRHIAKLQSLKCDYSNNETILELLKSCSDTIKNLDLTLTGFKRSEFATIYNLKRRHLHQRDHIPISINLSSLRHLQHLTIRAAIYFERRDTSDETCVSFLPAAMEILKTASSLQQLTIEINTDFASGYIDSDDCTTEMDVDYSPLKALAQSPGTFHHIDLHFYSGEWEFTHREIVALLAKYGGLGELIEWGMLVVHLNTSPIFLDLDSKCITPEDERSIVLPFSYHPSYWY